MNNLAFFEKNEEIYNRYLTAMKTIDSIGDEASKLTSVFPYPSTNYNQATALWTHCIQQHNNIGQRTRGLGLALSSFYNYSTREKDNEMLESSKECIINHIDKLNIEQVENVVKFVSSELEYLQSLV